MIPGKTLFAHDSLPLAALWSDYIGLVWSNGISGSASLCPACALGESDTEVKCCSFAQANRRASSCDSSCGGSYHFFSPSAIPIWIARCTVVMHSGLRDLPAPCFAIELGPRLVSYEG
jgi:hypothetical protein